MAGETIKTEAICLDIRPWSKTSHIVSWLTPTGCVVTVVKGAVRPKSFFLGQYDLNYTCEILYYARAKGEIHALRECAPQGMRETLRRDYRLSVLAGYFRQLIGALAPTGPDCRRWYDLLTAALDGLSPSVSLLPALIRFELAVLALAGLAPDFSGYDSTAEWSNFSLENGSFGVCEGRSIRISRAVAAYLADPTDTSEVQLPLDAARVIGVFYNFHLDFLSDVRRTVLGMIVQK